MSEETIESKLESEEVSVEEEVTKAEAEAEVVEEEEEVVEFSISDLESMIDISDVWVRLLSGELSLDKAKEIIGTLRKPVMKVERKVTPSKRRTRRRRRSKSS
ncbi:MAG: hypothetical protein B6U85_06730 [Desulfurococcales archaeon ex4484_42]|nr:MAG: hypothetical protein B6U85_06730 [Desulfurococcales archaeon ex4484_42]